jgi:hypothetical protein
MQLITNRIKKHNIIIGIKDALEFLISLGGGGGGGGLLLHLLSMHRLFMFSILSFFPQVSQILEEL